MHFPAECVGKKQSKQYGGRSSQSFLQRSQTPSGRSRARKSDIKPTGMEECTFKPRVNRVPRKFGSAHLYLQNNVHDRLSTPRASRGKVDGGDQRRDDGYDSDKEIKSKAKPVMNMDSFMSSLNASGSSRRPQSARRSRPGEMTLNRAQFQNFLARQNKRQTRKIKMRQGSGRSNSIAPTCAMQTFIETCIQNNKQVIL